MSNKDADPILLELVVRVLGCECEAEKVTSLRDIDAALLYEACVKGLKRIVPDVVFNSTLPRNNAAKVNVTQKIVQTLVEAGFRGGGDLSYSALMYPNESDTRTILLWLNQNITAGVAVDENAPKASAQDVLQTAIATEVRRQLGCPWAPLFFPGSTAAPYVAARPIDTVPIRSAHIEGVVSSRHAKQIEYIAQYMPFACAQPPRRDQVAASLLAAHAVGLARQRDALLQRDAQNPVQRRQRVAALVASRLRLALAAAAGGGHEFLLLRSQEGGKGSGGMASRFIRQRNQIDKVDVKVDVTAAAGGPSAEELAREAREKQLLELEEELKAVAAQVLAAQAALGQLVASKRQLDADAAAVAARAQELERARAEIEMVRRLMQDPEGNKAKLIAITQANAAKLLEAQQKWEPRRVALMNGYRAEKDKFEGRRKAAQGLLQEIEEMRGRAKEIATDVQQKDQRYRNLLEQFKAIEKGQLRSAHTEKIEEGLRNVKKQNADIDKVLVDTRDLKKEIAQTTDVLSRSFAIVDELIYKDAKADDASAKTAYKLLVAMNEKFNDLINSLSGTVQTRNAILDLERKIAALKIRTDTLDLAQVKTDLDALKQENVQLAVRVASLPQQQQQQQQQEESK